MAVSIIIRLITYSRSLYCLLSLKTPLNARLYDFFFAFPARTNDFPNSRQTGKQIPRASRAQILVNPASRKAVKSRFPSRYFASSRIPHRILVKSWIPKIPFHTLAKLQHSPANPASYPGYVRLSRLCRVPLARPFPYLFVYRSPVVLSE